MPFVLSPVTRETLWPHGVLISTSLRFLVGPHSVSMKQPLSDATCHDGGVTRSSILPEAARSTGNQKGVGADG